MTWDESELVHAERLEAAQRPDRTTATRYLAEQRYDDSGVALGDCDWGDCDWGDCWHRRHRKPCPPDPWGMPHRGVA